LRRVLSNFPAMRVVYVDASLRRTGIEWPPNATGLAFADSDSGYLAGFLSGFVSARHATRRHRRPMVSVVGGIPIPSVTGLVRAFVRGARDAQPGVATRAPMRRKVARQRTPENDSRLLTTRRESS
jgi:basic membrane lipoprotein Med (substrate-binding protein (PBP1-ABC) superfamily)